jgi:hypothetical protein
MANARRAGLAFGLLGALLSGCSLTQPEPRNFTQVDQRPAKAQETNNTLKQAEADCKAETEKKGIASITAIFSHFRKGAADEDYVACMKDRGFEVRQ